MTAQSKIEWTDATWNPVRGCTRVSEGCRNCYAEIMAARFSDPGQWGQGFARRVTLPDGSTDHRWTGRVELIESQLPLPLRWKKPRKIFVNSTSDIFHENLSDADIDRIFAVMALAPQHTFQILTKRPARMRAYVSATRRRERIARTVVDMAIIDPQLLNHAAWPVESIGDIDMPDDIILKYWPLQNVWLGTSIEDQDTANDRIPHLLATPAAIRFVSAEPLLGPLDLTQVGNLTSIRAAMPRVIEREESGRPRSGCGSICAAQIDAIGSPGSSITFFKTPDHMGGFTASSPRQWPRLDWIIAGGESGPGARPMHPDWLRALRDQCADAGVPFFFKQWGEWAPCVIKMLDEGGRLGPAYPVEGCSAADAHNADQPALFWQGGEWVTWPLVTDLPAMGARRVGKKAAGRLLDGREHNDFPRLA